MGSALRVLVVGAGPTGLMAAIELARRGIEVKLVEQRVGSSGLSRAVGLQPASLALLQASGAARRILSEAIAFQSVAVHREHELLAKIDFPASDPQAMLHGLAQDRTEFHLRATLESCGGELLYGHKLTALRQMSGRVVATLQPVDDGHAISEEFDYLIGADGVKSTVRDLLALDFKGFELAESWSIADIDCSGWDTSAFRIYLRDGGRIVVVAPMEANRVRVVSNTDDALETLPVPVDVVDIRRQSSFRIAIRQVANYRVGRVFLAGDAAHCHSPVGGRGMNLGIADAADLAARLSVGQGDGYHRARHAAGRQVIAESERTRKILMSRHRPVRSLVDAAFRAVGRYDFLQRRAISGILGRR